MSDGHAAPSNGPHNTGQGDALVADARLIAGFQRAGRAHGRADAQRADRRREHRVFAGVGLDAELDDLAVVEEERIGEAGDDVQVVILLDERASLAVVGADAEHAVIVGAFEPLVVDPGENLLGGLGRPVIEETEIAFIAGGAIERVVAVQRQAVGAGLHVLPAVGNLRLAGAEAVHLVRREVDIAVPVADLGEVVAVGTARQA